jgi:surface antigen
MFARALVSAGEELMRFVVVATVGLCLLSACAQPQGGEMGMSNTAGGAVIGAASGAALGAAFGGKNRGAAMLVGAAVGGLAGGFIGHQLDAQSEARRQEALRAAAQQPRGQVVTWTNPAQNTSGQSIRVSDITTINGRRCAQWQETITIGGKPQQVDGTKCQAVDGSWADA